MLRLITSVLSYLGGMSPFKGCRVVKEILRWCKPRWECLNVAWQIAC